MREDGYDRVNRASVGNKECLLIHSGERTERWLARAYQPRRLTACYVCARKSAQTVSSRSFPSETSSGPSMSSLRSSSMSSDTSGRT